jgi:hypothetical protein
MVVVEQALVVPYLASYVYALLADLGAARRGCPSVRVSSIAPPGLRRT